jgi:AcrR family transcriptional regulator
VSPRPQKVTDEQVYAAVYRVMQRVGPDELSLAAIAEEAGVTAGLLVQRFGSRRALMVRLAELAAESSVGMIARMREQHSSPLETLRAYVSCMAGLASSPDALVRSLAYLTEDLADPELRLPLERQGRHTREGLVSLVKEARDAGELVAGTKPKSLARTIEAIIPGSMMTWATYREGDAAKWMRRDLERVLEPFLAR